MSYPGYYSEGYYADDQIWAAVQRRIRDDSRYRSEFRGAVAQRSMVWLQRLIRGATLAVLGHDFLGMVDWDWFAETIMDGVSWLWDTLGF